jgi:hypothetical protein
MAFVTRAHCLAVLAALAAPALLVACTPDDNDEDTAADSTGSPVTTVTTGETASGSSGSTPTSDPTTTGDGTTTDLSTSTSTTDEPTTDPTTSDTTGGDDTGPICDLGMPDCACDGGACIDGYVCVMGVCAEALECPGDIEPNETEDTPTELGDISDDDDDFFDQFGVLAGASDVDWYRLHGSDTFGHVAEPTATVVTGQQRACVFLECDAGGVSQTTVECPDGTDFAISPKLRPGCCSAATFTIKDFGCPGQDESLQMWLRVDKPAADVCSDYNVKLHF